ncbi:MAG TPA: hypothetical protein VFV10_00355, partial [Gammaproteobacteria bacterium]|nr:hypothetical protein [Gammaproteobacteria bacterium]
MAVGAGSQLPESRGLRRIASAPLALFARLRRGDAADAAALGKLGLVVAAGALLPLAFAPFEWFWLAPLSYAVLFLAWRHARPAAAI